MPSFRWAALAVSAVALGAGVDPASSGDSGYTNLFPFAGTGALIDFAFAGPAATTPLDGGPRSLVAARDGSLYFTTGMTLWRVTRKGALAPVTGAGRMPTGVALGRDGSLFVTTETNSILRLRGNSKSVIAGTGECDGTGDGGPATSASICYPHLLSVERDGSLLTDDNPPAGERIRRVAPDGTITTVAGGGSASGRSGRAVDAKLGDVSDIAALPNGGFLVADSTAGRVYRVGADGLISVDAGRGGKLDMRLHNPRSVALLPGGGYLLATDAGLLRVTGSRARNLLRPANGERRLLGRPPASTRMDTEDVTVAADGDVFVSDGRRVTLLPRSRSRRPGLAIDIASVRLAHRFALVVRARQAGRAVITAARQKRSVRRDVRLHPGLNTVPLPAALDSAAYTITVSLRTRTGSAGDVARLLTGPRLTPEEAQLVLTVDQAGESSARIAEGVDQTFIGKCRAMGPTRADCAVIFSEYLGSTYCQHTSAVALMPSGRVTVRDYRGCKFSLRPKWFARARTAPLLPLS